MTDEYLTNNIYEASFLQLQGHTPLLKFQKSGLVIFSFEYNEIREDLRLFNSEPNVPLLPFIQNLKQLRTRMLTLKRGAGR